MSWKNYLKWKDEGLKTPEHDALMLWLDKNCMEISKIILSDLDKDGFYGKEWEKPLIAKSGSILCFIDLFLAGRKQIRPDYAEEYDILFEVKPKIDSIGELLRQLKSYEQYHSLFSSATYRFGRNKCFIIVISPDTKAKDIILSNGFLFYNPDDFEDSE